MILRIHHVQLAIPPGGEEQARAFYGGVLGMRGIKKPAHLEGLGGLWFECGESGMQLHLGVEDPFRPAKKAHPAMLVEELPVVETALRVVGRPVSVETQLEGFRRFYTEDPFGNRVEILAGGEGSWAATSP
jgi:catechol 2,3-dioxygenase-like lactoylglutathione lyase family enzyme